MTQTYTNGEGQRAGIGDLFSSMMEFGSATTRFTIDQVQTAVCMMTEPGRAIDRVKHTLDNLSSAISKPAEPVTGSTPEAAAETLSGRKV